MRVVLHGHVDQIYTLKLCPAMARGRFMILQYGQGKRDGKRPRGLHGGGFDFHEAAGFAPVPTVDEQRIPVQPIRNLTGEKSRKPCCHWSAFTRSRPEGQHPSFRWRRRPETGPFPPLTPP